MFPGNSKIITRDRGSIIVGHYFDLFVINFHQDQRKFIAAKARENITFTSTRSQCVGNAHEQTITL